MPSASATRVRLDSPEPLAGQLLHTELYADTFCRGHPRGDERRPPAARIPRLVRTPADPAEPLPARGVLPAVEVRGPPCHATILAAER